MPKLKAYTDRFGLVTSREFSQEDEIKEIIEELVQFCKVRKVYKITGKQSTEVKFILKADCVRPLYYIRPDGIKIKSLSIHPHNYPLKAVYADGRIEMIKISS